MNEQIPLVVCTYQGNPKQKVHIATLRELTKEDKIEKWRHLRPFGSQQRDLFDGKPIARPMVKLCEPAIEIPLQFVKDRPPQEISCRTCLLFVCNSIAFPLYPGTVPEDMLVLADLAEDHGLPHMALSLRLSYNMIRPTAKIGAEEIIGLTSLVGVTES